jgi:hypothetical protein
MSVYPNHNIIDSVYRNYKKLKPSVVINAQNSIFASTLINHTNDYSFVAIKNSKEMSNLCNLFNINAYITSDYLSHSQERDIYQQYHIKEILLLIDSPMVLLKKEDLILLRDRLNDVNKIVVGSQIASSWDFLKEIGTIDPGIPKYSLNTEPRKSVIVISDSSNVSKRICKILYEHYPDMKICKTFDDYNESMNDLNSYKVCVNLNTPIDSLYGLYAGCHVISNKSLYDHETIYENIEHIPQLIKQKTETFDIQEQKDVHYSLEQKYDLQKFAANMSNLMYKYIKEPFYI